MAGRADPETDRRFVAEAIRLARRGLGRTSPNPAVGAVVVRDGRVIGRGWHRRAGGPHAEIFALRQAGVRARGATLYLTLEPCSHTGRTGPCVEAVLAAGCGRVVVGVRDPNPRVRGRGLARLRRAGVEVAEGVLAAECGELIEDFTRHVTTGLPFVVLKLAITLDGRIATASGDSRWVTGPAARRRVHEMRNRLDAILVGSGTVLADDPALTCRLRGGRDPLRVVLDGRLRIPDRARVLRQDAAGVRIYTRVSGGARAGRLRRRGADVRPAGTSLRRILADLGASGVMSVLVEGGADVAARFLRAGLVDRLSLFVAPRLVGGDGRPAVGPLGVRRLREALGVRIVRIERLGDDLLFEGRPIPRSFRRSLPSVGLNR